MATNVCRPIYHKFADTSIPIPRRSIAYRYIIYTAKTQQEVYNIDGQAMMDG
jgi:hypothetical protein